MFEWLLTLIPWWAYALAGAIAIGAVWRLFGWRGAVAAAGAILPVLGFGWARNLGVEQERARRDREVLDHVVIRNEVEDDIADMGAQDVDQELAKWNRD